MDLKLKFGGREKKNAVTLQIACNCGKSAGRARYLTFRSCSSWNFVGFHQSNNYFLNFNLTNARYHCFVVCSFFCCDLSVGEMLNALFTTNWMWAKNSTHKYMARTIMIEWSRRVVSIVACCHRVKFCELTDRALRSQHFVHKEQNRSSIFWPYIFMIKCFKNKSDGIT